MDACCSAAEQTECFTPPLHPLPALLVDLVRRMREKVSVLQGFRPNEANAIDYRRAEGHFLAPHCDVSLRLRICASSVCLKGDGVVGRTGGSRGRCW